MTILCVDPKKFHLWRLRRQVRKIVPGADVFSCRQPEEALELAKSHGCDVLLSSTDLARKLTNGFLLARQIREINRRAEIIFITDHGNSQEALQSFEIRASGYLQRPYEFQRLEEEFQNLRYQVS